MVDNIFSGSSQESLPLSQDTFDFLFGELQAVLPVQDIPDSVNSTVVLIPKSEVFEEPLPSIPFVPSSLPASENWDGPYNFNVSFGPQEKNTKGVSWTYSKIKDKLYVGKDIPCPINFSANTPFSNDTIIRVMAVYGSPQHASEIVHRCVTHSQTEFELKIFEAEHLVRCKSNMARYEEDARTKRHSVVVPFEIPAVGQQYSTYIYEFACFGSCIGGPNRRPIMLIFTLELNGQVVGRRKLDVKICACPGRDCKADEGQLMPKEEKILSKKKKATEMVDSDDTFEIFNSFKVPPSKKIKRSNDGIYTIKVDDKDQYEFLVQMNKFYKMNKTIKNLHPEVKKALSLHIRSKNFPDSDSN